MGRKGGVKVGRIAVDYSYIMIVMTFIINYAGIFAAEML